MTITRNEAHRRFDAILHALGFEDGEGALESVAWDSPLADVEPERAVQAHPVWAEIAPTEDRGGFVPGEFNDPWQMDAHFLMTLWLIRQRAGVPMRVISDARDPDGDVGADKSAHKKRPCRAVDLHVTNSYERARIVVAAVREGVVRIGVYPGKASDAGSVHLDGETHPENPSPRIWTRY